MNRGRRGEAVFSHRKDYETFLAVLQDTSEMFDLRVAAYCLMSNHYHLLVQTPAGNLSRAMRHINGVYTQNGIIGAEKQRGNCSVVAIKASW
jgi:REP element-mobilizing transposase RayT